ncbi:YdcF family protein [Pseudomonas sp. ZM23]|uniref:YdcF family protein n=1 Tax=Pseudomonas triclosanedens TaxID=2961893 RepID=A0ABY7A098_9PSED|nr:YdcF family protein [Pseudomonas triclosanedens]MCP8464076.1 YdcF family protein [Pseudomonas triclosanedens]MCP8469160.1 YdcF family protein [Pseudomonas triclosanedens]MCP8475882.1 YdcF family protein [Pseudomonas triclosanedens]WAI50416.1 YdcF family protein [Pseudomonas triclosanedens]
MPVRFILKQLFMPPGLLLLLLLLGFLLRRRYPRFSVLCFFAGFSGLLVMSLPVTVEWAARQLERQPPLEPTQWSVLAQRADAIVVLGAGRVRGDRAWGEDQPGLMARERLRYAARLAKASGLPVLTSGGLHYGTPPSEARIMAQSLLDDYGVPVRWEEGRSRTTWENAQFSARMLRDAGIRRVVLVTNAAHMPRSLWSFERAGLEVVPAPSGYIGVDDAVPMGGWLPESRAIWQSGQLLNEAIGLVGYRLFYR